MPELPHFPHPADVIAEEGARNRGRSIDDRLAQLEHLIIAGRALAANSQSDPLRIQFKLRMEEATQRAHSEVFRRHG